MILDTSFLIDLMHKDKAALDKAFELESRNEDTYLTTVSVFELFTGIARSPNPKAEKEKVMNSLKNHRILPLDQESASIAGEIHGQMLKKGTPIGVQDSLIAGIAKRKYERVLTRNTKDFKKIHGLLIETY